MPIQGKGSERAESRVNLAFTIYDLLKQDHEKIRYLFDKIGKNSRKETAALQKLFSQLADELEIHMEGEERFFYSALEKFEESRAMVLESYEEHQVAKTLLGTFSSLAVDDERWRAKVSVLNAVIERHMQQEEEQLFKLARKALDKEQVGQIALKFQRHRQEGRPPARGASVEG